MIYYDIISLLYSPTLLGRPSNELASVWLKCWQRASNWSHHERGCCSLNTFSIIVNKYSFLAVESGKNRTTPFTTISWASCPVVDCCISSASNILHRWLRISEELMLCFFVGVVINGRADLSSNNASSEG